MLILGLPDLALADAHEQLNGSDTAWLLTSTALVLFMTIHRPRPLLRRSRTRQKCTLRPHAVFCTYRNIERRLGHHRL